MNILKVHNMKLVFFLLIDDYVISTIKSWVMQSNGKQSTLM